MDRLSKARQVWNGLVERAAGKAAEDRRERDTTRQATHDWA